MSVKLNKADAIIISVMLLIFLAAFIAVTSMGAVPALPVATLLERPPWMTNGAIILPKTNMALVWVEKRTIQVSTNNLDWQDMVVMTTNVVYVPLNQPQQYFRVYCGEVSSDFVMDFGLITWQTNLWVSTP